MLGFEAIVDQDKPVRLLSNIIQKGKVPHALLFTGIEGVGKKKAAKIFAMACNCKRGTQRRQWRKDNGDDRNLAKSILFPCGSCKSCRKITSDNHPDVIQITPKDDIIRISQIRELCHTLAMKPYEALFRVVLIADAHFMNTEAGNALLKLLEEPPDRTILILTACHSYDLLPTIVSRCQPIRFNPISRKTLSALIEKKYGYDAQEADLIGSLAKGSLTKAFTLAETGWIKRREWLISLLKQENSTETIWQHTGTILALSEKFAKNKEMISDTLEILKLWFRDLMIFPFAPDKVMNKDLTDQIACMSNKMNLREILFKYDAIQSAQEKINANANPRLALDVMMMKISGIYHEKSRWDTI